MSWASIGKSFVDAGESSFPAASSEAPADSDSSGSSVIIFAENTKKRKKEKKEKKEKKSKKEKKEKKEKKKKDKKKRRKRSRSRSSDGSPGVVITDVRAAQPLAGDDYYIDILGDRQVASFGVMHRNDIIPFRRCMYLVGGNKKSRDVLRALEVLLGRGRSGDDRKRFVEKRFFEAPDETDQALLAQVFATQSSKFNRKLRDDPSNVIGWLDFLDFQKRCVSETIRGKTKRIAVLLDKQLTILEAALKSNPRSQELHLAHINCLRKAGDENMDATWQDALDQCGCGSSLLWLRYYDWLKNESRIGSDPTSSDVEGDDHVDPALGHLLTHLRGQENCEHVVLDIFCEYAFTERMAGRAYRGIAMFQANVLRYLVQSQFVRSQAMFHPNDVGNLFTKLWDSGIRPGSIEFLSNFLMSEGVVPPPGVQEVTQLASLVGGAAVDDTDVDMDVFIGSSNVFAEWADLEAGLERKSVKASGSDMSSGVVSSLLLWQPSDSLVLELVYRFLEYLGSPIDDRSPSSDKYTQRLSVWRSQRKDANLNMIALLCCHCLVLWPQDPILFFALADATGSNKICKQVLSTRSQDWRFWAVYAVSQWKRGKLDASRKVFFQASSSFPNQKIALLSRLAHLELLRGQDGIQDAMKAFVGMVFDVTEGKVSLQALSVLKNIKNQIPKLELEDAVPGVGGICSSFFAAVWTASAYVCRDLCKPNGK